jgi:hypothetical protein
MHRRAIVWAGGVFRGVTRGKRLGLGFGVSGLGFVAGSIILAPIESGFLKQGEGRLSGLLVPSFVLSGSCLAPPSVCCWEGETTPKARDITRVSCMLCLHYMSARARAQYACAR